MTEQPRAWTHSVDERVAVIATHLHASPAMQTKLPGLKDLLDDYLDPSSSIGTDEDQEGYHRRLLRVFRDSKDDFAYEQWLTKLQLDDQKRVEEFVDGGSVEKAGRGYKHGVSLGVREHIEELVRGGAKPVVVEGLNNVIVENDQSKEGFVQNTVDELIQPFKHHHAYSSIVYKEVPFQNWGLDVQYVPSYTCIPTSVAAIQQIIRYAKTHDLGVRCAGFRHSWSPIFGRNGQITISLLPLQDVTKIPNFTALGKAFPQSKPTELETIESVVATSSTRPKTPRNTLVRIGVSTTNERLRRWCIDNGEVTIPLNTIMVEMTIGGTNGSICHGAGRQNTTLSDLVRRVEYIDCNGELRIVEDSEHLKAASGCFGLMGVITHLTLEFHPMTYALMKPQKLAVVHTIPPPDNMLEEDIPPALRIDITPEKRQADIEAFEKHCTDDYYVEYFWFPYADECWINNWNNTEDSNGVIDYPSEAQTFFMFVSQFTLNLLQDSKVLNELANAVNLDTAAVTLLSRTAMLALPAWDKPVKTYLTDALHFQRGIQNVRVLDMEVEMPLLPKKENPSKPSFDLVRRAWWDAILECYKHSDTCPQRMPLEMRIMGDSEIIMAPQRGNTLGTCSIEILTLESAKSLWKPYAEEVLAKWLSYTDTEGKPLRSRPHWAKQWAGFEVNGRPWLEKMKDVDNKDEILEFKRVLGKIGKDHGWTLANLKKRFSNDLFDSLFFDNV
ncbi:hypothetical protein BD289DRAFT_409085 [Coniella lustricola]|uniref:FAD-binding PCMH-type domain-containing protein n=1 Tax=Coniella lustricola TaxID=2025994 RepID=A0A2T3A8F4_9PEZI|nr:hypothetical protein BD289DRAFT_409085 [Coniella lustricola]